MEELLTRTMGSPIASALQLGLLARLVLAAVLGGIVGLEREVSGKPAGLRTNLLICVGAALLMELSIGVAALANIDNMELGSPFRADPGRIAAQIVSGIGFLGAGTIIQSRGNVTGLTTAATIWVVAAIGMAVGAEAYIMAIGGTALVVFSLMLLGRIEHAIIRRRRTQRYLFVLDPDPGVVRMLEETFRRQGLRVEIESVEKGPSAYEASFDISGSSVDHERVLRRLIEEPGVRRMTRVL